MIVVDTNVVSELMRPSPSGRVRDWIQSQPGRDLYTSAVTVAEVLYGIERLPQGRRQAELRSVATELFDGFADQVLTFDAAAAVQYSLIVSRRDRSGLPIDGFDAQIAAICLASGAALATRNVADFRETGIDVINPWDGQD
ncbi:MAG TPA: type II toxin-antitoxin system VapC family toxin [Streptosporangiaceae bacterium]|nr:type II toxin-antitoxin system VapC family toxin [Streptosporangiaceae bacterium]